MSFCFFSGVFVCVVFGFVVSFRLESGRDWRFLLNYAFKCKQSRNVKMLGGSEEHTDDDRIKHDCVVRKDYGSTLYEKMFQNVVEVKKLLR